MRSWLARNIKGDKVTWAIILIFTLFSFLAVYSASTNLVYVIGKGTTFGHFLRHGIIVFIGFVIIYITHKIPYRFSRPISKVGLFLSALFLIIAALKGTTIDGANASRWIQVPVVGISFQPSTFALVMLMTYVASYLAENYGKKPTFSESFLPLWLPVAVIIGLIVPSNLSTAVLGAGSVGILTFIGRHPLKNILTALCIGIVLMAVFVLTVKAFPDNFKNTRVSTWVSRIESFTAGDDEKEGYQIERAKMAIAKGGLMGEGAGKSTMKNFLPQSSSDFIYAIVTEEYGSFGALVIMALYVLLLLRIVIISQNARTIFGQLLVLGVGFPIILQALINMGVAVELFPVTGQNLPLISSGGTSIWMTCLALGLILSVSTSKRNSKQQAMEKDKNLAEVEEELAEEIMEEIQKRKEKKLVK
ncbi:cell division protein FtsW [Capnocytophaga stomatis]|uniref:Probable peptidoglycan glycosyltransferase FtsW n=1 Tax=Capnocytophaga stomatis TaxID=1848904 RepID=A0A250FX19_9FLAO|nr:FtsW/RodA/SpoVE family cell cycle protein [Capnocytophaga stomatis]ATA89692.1 cell division protein FtsW [Capnocytophaga stomatis]GIJ97392.1 cell division protein FtsW [Capnocytophaga stomatis]